VFRGCADIEPRRQEFSAEDELDEVEEDQRARTIGSIGSSGYSGMRRRSQVFRRRNTQPLHQGINDDEGSDDEDDIPQRQVNMSQTVGGDELDDDADEGTVRGAGSYAGSEVESDQSFTLKVIIAGDKLGKCQADRFSRIVNKQLTRRILSVSEYGNRRFIRKIDPSNRRRKEIFTLRRVKKLDSYYRLLICYGFYCLVGGCLSSLR
jgi:hypothetical protein